MAKCRETKNQNTKFFECFYREEKITKKSVCVLIKKKSWSHLREWKRCTRRHLERIETNQRRRRRQLQQRHTMKIKLYALNTWKMLCVLLCCYFSLSCCCCCVLLLSHSCSELFTAVVFFSRFVQAISYFNIVRFIFVARCLSAEKPSVPICV